MVKMLVVVRAKVKVKVNCGEKEEEGVKRERGIPPDDGCKVLSYLNTIRYGYV